MDLPPSTSSSDRPINLTDLNADALTHCVSFLSLRDVSTLATTCKTLCKISYSNVIWRRLFSERWPSQCIYSGAGVRQSYLAWHIALNQLKFCEPKRMFIYQNPISHSHILLRKNQAFLAQGSIIHQIEFEPLEAERMTTHSSLLRHNARITCMRLLPLIETSLFRKEMQTEENVFVTSSLDCTIRLWWKGHPYPRCFKGHNGPVTTLADKLLGNYGTKVLASGGEDCTVRLWLVGANAKRRPLKRTYHGHEKPISFLSVSWHKDSLLVSLSTDSRIRVWDTSSPSSSSSSSCVGMTCVSGPLTPPVGMKCHDTQCYVAAGSSVTSVDLRTMQRVSTTAVHPSNIYSFEMLPSKWLICTGGDGKAMLWDIRKNQVKPEPVAVLENHVGRVTMLHMDPYKVVTAGPSDYHINVWETGTGSLANRLNCRVPGESGDFGGVSAMAVDGCRIISSGCTEDLGTSCFWNFNNCSIPTSSDRFSSHSMVWDFQHRNLLYHNLET